MRSNEFDPEDLIMELNQKFAHVSIENADDMDREIHYEELNELKNDLEAADYPVCYNAMRSIRKYLTQDITSQRIQHVMDLYIEDKLCTFLGSDVPCDLQYEAAWTITNLAYGSSSQTEVLIQAGVVDKLLECFQYTSDYRVMSQISWALANVAIESPEYRENLAQGHFIESLAAALSSRCDSIYGKLSSQLEEENNVAYDGHITIQIKRDAADIRDLTWALSNICRGGFKTVEHWKQYIAAFSAFSQCINFENEAIWTEACWGLSRILSNMFNFEPFFESLVLNPGLCPRLVGLLRDKDMHHVLPVVQTICNFSSGPNSYIEHILNADLLSTIWWYTTPEIPYLLRRNSILTISNVAAGHQLIVKKVVENKFIMDNILKYLEVPGHAYNANACKWEPSVDAINHHSTEEWKITKEVLWVLSNITNLADDTTISEFLSTYKYAIQSLVRLLHYPMLNASLCSMTTEVLTNIVDRTNSMLDLGSSANNKTTNPYIQEMLSEGIMPAISFLYHKCPGSEFMEKANLFRSAIVVGSNGLQSPPEFGGADQFGFPLDKTNIRRIVQNYDDGDVRFIESAMNSILL